MVTLSFELSTTACVWGTRTTWWSNAAVGSHTRAGSLWLSSESSEMSLCVFCSLVGRVASLFPMPIRDLMNSRWGVRRTGWQEDSRTPKNMSGKRREQTERLKFEHTHFTNTPSDQVLQAATVTGNSDNWDCSYYKTKMCRRPNCTCMKWSLWNQSKVWGYKQMKGKKTGTRVLFSNSWP